MRPIYRILPIVPIAFATLWFGVTFGPVRGVRADVYIKLASVYQQNPDPTGAQSFREGVTLMNSGKMNYRVYQSSETIHQVLDGYERAFTPPKFHLFDRKRFPPNTDIDKALPQLPFLETLVSRTRQVREETSQWGYLSYFDLGEEANLDWHVSFGRKYRKFAQTGRIGDLGTARSIVTVPNLANGHKSTTVMSYWTDPDFNVHDLEEHGDADLPGRDIEGLPRIHGLRRVLTFDQVEAGNGFLMVMYRTQLAPVAAIAEVGKSAQAAGWTVRDWADPQQKTDPMLFLRRNDQEVTVFTQRDKNSTSIVVTCRRKS